MPSPELQSPFSCTWKPCSPLGLSPVTFALTATLSPRCVKVTVPAVELPFVASSLAMAFGPSSPPIPMDAQPARKAAAEANARILFITFSVVGGLGLLRCVLRGRLLRSFLQRLLPGLGSCGGRRGSGGRRRRRDRRGLRNGLARLLHVSLEVLHRGVLGCRLIGLGLVRGDGVLRL